MSTNDESSSSDTKKWNITVPEPHASHIVELVKMFGYASISEFYREAGRNLALHLDEKMSRRILDQLISMGKITTKDLRAALYEVSIPRTI